MLTVLSDLRYALRALVRRPLFALSAVLILALGIGANGTVLSLADAVLLRPMPGAERPERLVWLSNVFRPAGRLTDLSYPDYLAYRDRSGAFASLAVYQPAPVSLGGCPGGGCGEPARLQGELVSASYFPTLGLRPALGRFILPDEDRVPGASPVVVLGHGLWRSRFGGDSAVVGRRVVLNGVPFTVVGVAPERFAGPEVDRPAQLWVPVMMYRTITPGAPADALTAGGPWGSFKAIGRLRDDVSRQGAEWQVREVARQLHAAEPEARRHFAVSLAGVSGVLHPSGYGETYSMVALGMAVAGIVLLIACANVGNLLLSRAAARRREIAIRFALGASRGRIVRQLLWESTILALCGGALAFLYSLWLPEALVALVDAPLPLDFSPSGRVVAATLVVALVTGVLFGLAPALAASRRDVLPSLTDGGGALINQGPTRRRLQSGFLAAQIALSLVLLTCAGLLVRSLRNAGSADLGFDARGNVVVASLDVAAQGYAPERRAAFHRELLARARAFPGVEAASFTSLVPFGGTMQGAGGLAIEGRTSPEDGGEPLYFHHVWPGYFAAIGTPVARGRDFAERDAAGAPPTAVVNEEAARRFWPGENPLGKRFRLGGERSPLVEVVGVVRNGRYDEANERPRPYLYFAEPQRWDRAAGTGPLTLIVRSRTPAVQTVALLRETVRVMDPALPVFDLRTMEQVVQARFDKQRASRTILALFGGLALLLAAVGVYAVTAQAVAQSTREIGVRVALGATAGAVLALFVGRGARLALAGVVAGSLLSLGAARVLASSLVGVSPADPLTFAAVSALLVAVTTVAALLPARRAARVEPAVALRQD